jgi:TonB family protein
MNRLQKKCLVAAAGSHLLVVVVVVCSGFVRPKPSVDDVQLLTMIPSTAVDRAVNAGRRDVPLPTPTPMVAPPVPVPEPQTPPPQPPEVKPIEPVRPVEPVAQPPRPEPDDAKPDDLPTPKPPKQKHEIKVDLTEVTRNPKKAQEHPDTHAEKEAQKLAQRALERERAFNKVLNTIRDKATTSTSIDMPGDSTEAYASYASIVKTVYTEAWIMPQNADNDLANVKVSITIANTGRVMDAHIVEPSGDASVDRSVQRTLDRVTELRPFPDGATDKERTYIINFNLKAKRQMQG